MTDARKTVEELASAVAEVRAQLEELDELSKQGVELAVPEEITDLLRGLDDAPVFSATDDTPAVPMFGIQG